MAARYILFRRGNGVFYVEDRETGKQTSLKTRDKSAAAELTNAKNAALRHPCLTASSAEFI